jgi:DNA-binding LytR/AlgR family response regulator
MRNQNLSENLFNILKQAIAEVPQRNKIIEDDKIIGFIQLNKFDYGERILLRRMITEGVEHIVIVSSNPKLAQFAWKTGAFHFMEFPFTISQLKLLKQKYEDSKLSSKTVNKKIRLGYTGGYDFIPLSEINMIHGQGDYINLYRQNIKAKTYTYRISKVEKALEHQYNFIKLTKSIIININNVSQIIGNKVSFTGKGTTSLELSPRAVKTLKDELLWINI